MSPSEASTVILEENETCGPKVGVKISLEEADLIIQRHFPTRRASKISHIDRGYNNRVYIVSTSSDSEPEKDLILRLSGRFWTRYKTENEVCALLYLCKRSPSLLIPKVLGYCTDKEKSGINAEYILMEKVKGEPLENIWDGLNVKDKKHIIDQLAILFSKIQKIRFDKIGSFQFSSDDIVNSSGIGIDPEQDLICGDREIVKLAHGVEFDGGPYENFIEYFKNSCETEINFLKKCNFMKGCDGYEERLKRIQNFVNAFQSMETIPVGLDKKAIENVPYVFTQGDFEPRNIMVDKKNMKITGLLDFEWGGACPIDDEWFAGFAFVDADTTEWRVYNEERPRHDDLCQEEQEVANSIRDYFLNQMRKNGVAVPDDIPGHMARAELFYFRGFISPWWLREEVNPRPEGHYGDRIHACKRVEVVLDKYGF